MGERKGQNHYYPPNFDYKVHGSLNAYHGVHPLRERGKRAHEGILTIRFEMPFNAWCLSCNNHIGMGVRYNAEKKKIGMYYTTPLYEFQMPCHLCSGKFIIRTDPKNFDYEMVEGIRRQEKRFDPADVDNAAPLDREVTNRLAADAMFKMEHVVEDKKKLATTEGQIQKLESIQSRMYDDYRSNSILRRSFRTEKKELNEKRAKDEELKKRLSTSIRLLPENSDDRKMAHHILKFGNSSGAKDAEERRRDAMREMLSQTIFPLPASLQKPSTSAGPPKDPKAELRKRFEKQLGPMIALMPAQGSASPSPTKKKRQRSELGIVFNSSNDPPGGSGSKRK